MPMLCVMNYYIECHSELESNIIFTFGKVSLSVA